MFGFHHFSNPNAIKINSLMKLTKTSKRCVLTDKHLKNTLRLASSSEHTTEYSRHIKKNINFKNHISSSSFKITTTH